MNLEKGYMPGVNLQIYSQEKTENQKE